MMSDVPNATTDIVKRAHVSVGCKSRADHAPRHGCKLFPRYFAMQASALQVGVSHHQEQPHGRSDLQCASDAGARS